MDYKGKCRHPHGHNGKVEIELEADKLDKSGMVLDFSRINKILKNWIDETLDHKMLLRKDDPLIPALKKLKEPYFAMKENPTAENIAKLIYDYAGSFGLPMPIVEVRFWETDFSIAKYRK